jgi:hypothetical protein
MNFPLCYGVGYGLSTVLVTLFLVILISTNGILQETSNCFSLMPMPVITRSQARRTAHS